MNADLKKLIRLQEVDLAISEYRAKTDAFPEKSKALDEKLASALRGVEDAKEAIQASQVKRKDHESKVADLETKISKYREQLMSVKTNEEYKAMNKEIEFSQAAISKGEDQLLAIMEQAEALAEGVKSAETTLAEDQKLVAIERQQLEGLNARDVETLEAYASERKELGSGIDEEIFDRYERVRKARGGLAIAKATDETCIVCNVRMRPQRFQEVRQNDTIIPCDSCGRILYDPENMDHPFEVA
jgi:predicted  nucleic acid-binding Zn-ribbon protein